MPNRSRWPRPEPHHAELARERRYGPPAAAVAFLAAVLQLAAVWRRAGLVAGPATSERAILIRLEANSEQAMVAAAVEAFATVMTAGVLLFLLTAISHRRPLPRGAGILVGLAPIVAAASLLLVAISFSDVAREFVGRGDLTPAGPRLSFERAPGAGCC